MVRQTAASCAGSSQKPVRIIWSRSRRRRSGGKLIRHGTADKSSLRSNYLRVRRTVPARLRISSDEAIRRALRSFDVFRRAPIVLTYVSFGAEVDTRALIEELLDEGRRVAVPRVDRAAHKMAFHEIESLEGLVPGTMGILEPPGDTPALTVPEMVRTACLVPGLVFDGAGAPRGLRRRLLRPLPRVLPRQQDRPRPRDAALVQPAPGGGARRPGRLPRERGDRLGLQPEPLTPCCAPTPSVERRRTVAWPLWTGVARGARRARALARRLPPRRLRPHGRQDPRRRGPRLGGAAPKGRSRGRPPGHARARPRSGDRPRAHRDPRGARARRMGVPLAWRRRTSDAPRAPAPWRASSSPSSPCSPPHGCFPCPG